MPRLLTTIAASGGLPQAITSVIGMALHVGDRDQMQPIGTLGEDHRIREAPGAVAASAVTARPVPPGRGLDLSNQAANLPVETIRSASTPLRVIFESRQNSASASGWKIAGFFTDGRVRGGRGPIFPTVKNIRTSSWFRCLAARLWLGRFATERGLLWPLWLGRQTHNGMDSEHEINKQRFDPFGLASTPLARPFGPAYLTLSA